MLIASPIFRSLFFGMLGITTAAHAGAQTPREDRSPYLPTSIANGKPNQVKNGPLFERIKAAVAAANEGNGEGFKRFLSPGSELTLRTHVGSDHVEIPFTVDVIRAATQSCDGPLSHDEGATWAQLSWVCRSDPEAMIAKYIKFRDSPEIVLTVWFDGTAIKGIDATEPIPVPGARLVTMDAYAVKHGTQGK